MKYTATFVNTAFTVQEKEIDTDFAPHTLERGKTKFLQQRKNLAQKGTKTAWFVEGTLTKMARKSPS